MHSREALIVVLDTFSAGFTEAALSRSEGCISLSLSPMSFVINVPRPACASFVSSKNIRHRRTVLTHYIAVNH